MLPNLVRTSRYVIIEYKDSPHDQREQFGINKINFMRLLLYIFILVFTNCTANIPNQKAPTSYVIDKLNLFTAEEKDSISTLLTKFERKTSAEILLYITDTLNDQSIDEFAFQLFNDIGIGKKGINNGILLVLAPNQKSLRLEIGYGMEWFITDSISSTIINEMIPFLIEGKYYDASKMGINRIIEKTSVANWDIAYSSYSRLEKNISNSMNKLAIIEIERIIVLRNEDHDYSGKAILRIKNQPDVNLIYTEHMGSLVYEIKQNPGKKIIGRVSSTDPLTLQLLGTSD